MQARETHRSGEALKGVKAQAGEKFMSFKHTHAGAADAVLFATYGLPDMADVDYRIGGTGTEITHVLIHGNVNE